MMIDSVTHPSTYAVANFFRNGVQQGGQFAGRSIETIRNLPGVAHTVFVVSHAIFLALSDFFANAADVYLNTHLKFQSKNRKLIQSFFVDGIAFGGSFALLSSIFSRSVLNQTALLTLTIAAAIARIFFRNQTALQKEIVEQKK